ncbi:hypothetical protein [Metabacillus fastidiosus]|uniref:hypothetical protein n=1 Tax=Metabacillus fastidiosus TaxID=1458 RepID=UPI003D28D5AF
MIETNVQVEEKVTSKQSIPNLRCGIIMPIAAMGDYTETHWQDVKNIIIEATQQISGMNFKTEIVSNSDGEINIIHKNIISNIYNSDIVVCDISGRNPNVLFELGMRLTFDKPTIIIKDDETPYIFDTSSIETLTYPKDLRFNKIIDFKETLATRIRLTYEKARDDSNYSPFLGHFGEFKVPSLNLTTVTEPQQIILDEISSLRAEIKAIRRESAQTTIEQREIQNKNKNETRALKQYIETINDYNSGSTTKKKPVQMPLFEIPELKE